MMTDTEFQRRRKTPSSYGPAPGVDQRTAVNMAGIFGHGAAQIVVVTI